MDNDSKQVNIRNAGTVCNNACNLVAEEQRLLYEELERMSVLIKEAIGDLSNCFSIMSDQLSKQKLTLQSTARIRGNKDIEGNIDDLMFRTTEIDSIVIKAVISLQFEDIIQQLIQHSRLRIEKIDNMCELLDQQISSLISVNSGNLDQFQSILETCQSVIDKTRKDLDLDHPAQQYSMARGDTTLF